VKPPNVTGKAGAAKAGAAGALLDVGTSVWKNRHRLADPEHRADATRDVLWDGGQAVAGNAAGAGAGALATAGLALAEGATFTGAAVLTTSTAAVTAPLVAVVAVGWVANKGIQALRERAGRSERAGRT